jgi:cob(I)alamin adenosyltransferase
MEKKYFQIYTGNGKGKTTAALGLIMRATGAGYRIYLGQFVKSMEYNENRVLREHFPNVKVEQFGAEGCTCIRKPDERDIEAARKGVERVIDIERSGKYDLIILDEIFIGTYLGLISEESIKRVISEKPEDVELVMTGRYAPESIIQMADLVTEMKEVKHYYKTMGLTSREGIEK